MSNPAILKKTAAGAGWVVAWRMATRVLGFGNTLVLVRLLSPADFGLVALGTMFTMAVDALSTLGIEEALIREAEPDRSLYDTGFTLNVLRGMLTTVVVAGLAYPMAAFFHEPRLAALLLALAAGTFITAFESIGIVEFRRDIDFRREFILLILPRVGSICVSIALALATRSYWSLVAAILTGYALRVALGYAMHPYRPHFALSGWRRLAGFSFWSWILGLIILVRDRSDALIIGRIYDAADVGVYGLGSEIAMLPTTELAAPLARACYSGFSAARHAGSDAGGGFLRVVAAMALVALPCGLGVSLLGAPLVRLVFGPDWGRAAIVVQVLGAVGPVAALGTISSVLLSAYGLLRPMATIQITTGVMRVGLMVVLLHGMGFAGAAVAVGAATTVESVLFVRLVVRQFGLRPGDLLGCAWRPVLASAVMAVALWGLGSGWAPVDGSHAALAVLVTRNVALGAAVYGAVLLALWLACGRPAGAESDVGALGWRAVSRVLPRWPVRA